MSWLTQLYVYQLIWWPIEKTENSVFIGSYISAEGETWIWGVPIVPINLDQDVRVLPQHTE